jgi:putative salt-induced outer membrane protein YdiY
LVGVIPVVGACSVGADVVLMSNGDWLSGTVATMVDGELTLETEYAGPVAVQWDRVVRLVLDRPLPVVLDDGAELDLRELPTIDIAMSDVRSLAPPPAPPPPPARWHGRADFGWATASGNRNTELGTLTAFAQRARVGRYRLSFLFDAAQGESEGEETANRARLEAKYDRAAGDASYRYYLAGVGYDRIRDIDLRTELGAGVGRTLIDKPGHILTAEVGASFVADGFAGGSTESDAKLRVGEAWRRDLDARTSVRQSLALLAVADDPQDFTAELVVALSHSLWGDLSLTSKIVDTYDSRPAPSTERNDFTFTTQLGVAFGE